MENLISYLEEQKIDFKQVDENVVVIDGKSYKLIKPDEEGKLFTEDFILIADNTNCDNYVFSFGGNYYWTPSSSVEDPELNKLKWLGRSTDKIPTESFLGIRGPFELLNGSGLYRDWCRKAKFLGVKTLGLCEKNTLAGIVKFQTECLSNGIKPILGATYTVLNGFDVRYDLKLYVESEDGWSNLLMINKEVNVTNNKYISEEDLRLYLSGLVVVLDPKTLEYKDIPHFLKSRSFYQLDSVIFDDDSRDQSYLLNLKKYVDSNLQPISITDAYYLNKEDSYLKLKLNSMSESRDWVSDNQYFKSKEDYFLELETLFSEDGERLFKFLETSLENERYLVETCNFQLSSGVKLLPRYIMKGSEGDTFSSNEELFWSIIEKGLSDKIPPEKWNQYLDRIEVEYEVINLGGFVDYFLILWDIIQWCEEKGILTGIGRGSAGGSLVAYLMNVTRLDPLEFDLLFERFLNKGRVGKSLPDIDCDFPAERRDEVKQYMEQRYGKNQICSVGTYTTFKLKSAVKDLAKQFGVDFQETNYITSILDDSSDGRHSSGETRLIFKEACKKERIKSFVQNNADVINTAFLISLQPKSNSIHACATLILPEDKDIFHWIPVRSALATSGETVLVSEWEGGELESLGFLKEDILGIKQLDKFQHMLSLIKDNKGASVDIYKIPYDDKRTLSFFSKGWSQDTFHFGSTGLTGYCKQLKPENLGDLIAAIALYRPGTIDSNLHNEYILRKDGEKEITYEWGTEGITSDTYGVVVYQEQIMKTCVEVAGFSLVEADDIRKAMGKINHKLIDSYKTRFIDGAIKKGCPQEEAESLWDKLEKFASYSFNKSHAAAYAITGYISQWFKVHYPIEFWTVAFDLVDSSKRDLKIPQFISEINKTGDIKVAPPDINNSASETTSNFQLNTIYWGLISVRQCGEIAVGQIIEERYNNGKYFSLDEFLERHTFKGSKVNKSVVENLILSGAFDEVEEVKYPSERMRLINYYREKNKVKPDKEKDLFIVNKDSIKEDYWWSLQQKRMSGLSFFDYQDLCDKYIGGRYIDQQEYQSESLHYTTQYSTGGYISEVIERTSKKGKYCSLYIESNYFFLWTTIFPEQYKLFIDNGINLVEEKSSIILLSGNIVKDNYRKENTMRMNNESQFLILK